MNTDSTATATLPDAGPPASPPRGAGAAAATSKAEPVEWVIDARGGTLRRALVDAWRSRELLGLLIERDWKVRYRQAALGVAWAVLTPLAFTAVLTVVFGVLARLGPEHVPYAPFLLAGLLAWNYFNAAVTRCTTALQQGSSLLSRVYFPRLLLPLANLIVPLADWAFGLLALGVILVWYRLAPTAHAVFLPLYALLAIVAALGAGTLLGALNAYYRDVRLALPVVMRLLFFLTPVVYAAERVPEGWRTLYAVNPMVSVIEGIRAGLIGTAPPTAAMVGVSAASAVVLLVVGVNVFHRLEKTVADVV